jgi:glycine cleavage system protein P-like pyridoxal-binding family
MNDDLPTVYYPLSVLDSLMLEPSGTMSAIERAVAEERAAVVAWLRREIQKCGCDDDTAACIERGEHRREDAP